MFVGDSALMDGSEEGLQGLKKSIWLGLCMKKRKLEVNVCKSRVMGLITQKKML